MFDKLFGRTRKKTDVPDPDIHFGRYSDNNKSVEKVNRWTEADNLYKDKKFFESIDAFFDYLRDDEADNVVHERNGKEGRFQFFQGSKIVRGTYNEEQLSAEVSLAKMPNPSVPVMRRLLEMNFNLYYSRYSMDQDRLCMRFDSELDHANPSKLYYGLKELATKADKQDDLLVGDFVTLQPIDVDHITEIPDSEKAIKFDFVQKWITETLDYVVTLDADKLSGGIAYLLLALCYRIDYLVKPEGKVLHELEKIAELYFKKDERQVQEKNRDMVDMLRKFQEISKEDFFKGLYRSRHTFAIVMPQQYKTIADAVYNANQNVAWYRENNHPKIAEKICEYGICYCQYSYSLPKPVTEFIHIFMMVNYSDYFQALGFTEKLYIPADGSFDTETILEKIKQVQDRWKVKYPNLNFRTENIRFDDLVNFNFTFATELEFLNLDNK